MVSPTVRDIILYYAFSCGWCLVTSSGFNVTNYTTRASELVSGHWSSLQIPVYIRKYRKYSNYYYYYYYSVMIIDVTTIITTNMPPNTIFSTTTVTDKESTTNIQKQRLFSYISLKVSFSTTGYYLVTVT